MARRRRSKYAIDFNQDIKTVARLVLSDLLRKHPRGANGKLNSSDYNYDRSPRVCRGESAEREGVGTYCGYTEDQMWSIFGCGGPLGDRHAIRREIENAWMRNEYPSKSEEELAEMSRYWMPSATKTRRRSRIDDRVRAVTRNVEMNGRPGIYKVNTGYGTAFKEIPFFVWAQNKAEAVGQFSTLTKPLIAAVDADFNMEDSVSVQQHKYDVESSELLDSTQLTIDKMDSREKELIATIEQLQGQLEGLRGIKGMVTDMAVQSITSLAQ